MCNQSDGVVVPPAKGVVQIVSYSDLFQFALVVIGIIGIFFLYMNNKKK
jgi:hypothetical protein